MINEADQRGGRKEELAVLILSKDDDALNLFLFEAPFLFLFCERPSKSERQTNQKEFGIRISLV